MLTRFKSSSLRAAQGFTLIEIMVAVVIVAIIAGVAIPNMAGWIGKARVRAGVEDLQNAIRLAQTEAAKRNQIVEFALTGTMPLPDTSNVNTTPAVDNGSYWVIRALPTTGNDKLFLQSGDLGSRGIKLTNSAGDSNQSLLFSGIGRVLTQTNPDAYLTDSRVYRVVSTSNKYPICVITTPGGGVRWCDPNSLAGSRLACPADITCPTTP